MWLHRSVKRWFSDYSYCLVRCVEGSWEGGCIMLA